MSEQSFSFQELREAAKIVLPESISITATDGIRLSYRRYLPTSPCAVVLFYHGGGAHSGVGYQHVGYGLQSQFNMVVYTPDIRAHGTSGGPRGDAPTPKQVWDDITTFIRHIRTEFPKLPLFLGGHSSGAGMVLNYSFQPNHELVDGYTFLSPQLGTRAQVDRPSLAAPFAVVDSSRFAAYAMSGGALHGHDYAVQFNYPTTLLASDLGLIAAITVNMSIALVPSAPHEQFAALNLPFGLWIGSDDELFLPDKVLEFGKLASVVQADSEVSQILHSNHLGILVNAHETIGPWIANSVLQKTIQK